jgi:glycerophosphoryl diester phosphodiesterase
MMNWKYALIVCAMTSLLTGPISAVEIIAHRGASFDAPENTVAAMRLGYEQAADAGELDIYLTKDRRIVVLHDGDTARVSSVTNKPAETVLEDLRRLPAGQWGKWKGSQFAETIPSLEEMLAVVPRGKRIFIEVKCGAEILPELARVLHASGLNNRQLAIIGFDYETMLLAKAQLPRLQVFWLVGVGKHKKYPPVEELIAKAKKAGFDGLNLEQGFPIDSAFVKQVRGAGLKLYTWTVDDPVVARRLAEAGVDGITTNRPKWLREQLSAQGL